MSWQAILKNIVKSGDKWDIIIVYTDGVNQVNKGYPVSKVNDDIVKSIARGEIANLESVEKGIVDITIIKGSAIDVTVPAISPTIPTQTEIDKQNFFSKLQTFQKLKQAVSLGFISATDSRVITVKDELTAAFKQEYIEGL